MTSVMWFRRDLPLADHPALLSEVSDAADPRSFRCSFSTPRCGAPVGPARRAYLAASLTGLGTRVGGYSPAAAIPSGAPDV